MSGLLHKVKDAVTGEKNTPEARAANQGSNGESLPDTFSRLCEWNPRILVYLLAFPQAEMMSVSLPRELRHTSLQDSVV